MSEPTDQQLNQNTDPKPEAKEKTAAAEPHKKEIVFDYKDPLTLFNYITEGGKILPSRINGLSHKQQKQLKNAIKKARRLNFLPIGTTAFDTFSRPEPISKKPFQL